MLSSTKKIIAYKVFAGLLLWLQLIKAKFTKNQNKKKAKITNEATMQEAFHRLLQIGECETS